MQEALRRASCIFCLTLNYLLNLKTKRMRHFYIFLLILSISVQTAYVYAESENKEVELPVKFSTSITSDSALKKTRSIDGEQPVMPLNVTIGPRKLTLWGYAQTSYDYKSSAGKEENAFNITRIILMANAELTDRLNFFIMYDAVKSELHEYYAQYAILPELKIRIGQYKQPFTLESLISPTLLTNICYDASVLYMAGIATDECQGNNVARDAGIMITGEAVKTKDGGKLLAYSLGIFNGPGMNKKENNSQKDVIGMLNVTPIKGVMLSSSFILGTGHAQKDNEYGAFKEGENYKRQRWAIGTEIKSKPLYIRSEYMLGNDEGIHSQGLYVNAEYHTPLKNFDLVGGYDYLKKNNLITGSEENNYMLGAQYWFHKRCRILSEFIFRDPNSSANTRQWITQLQIGF